MLLTELSKLLCKQHKEPTLQKAYSDCFLLLTKHFYEQGKGKCSVELVDTYKELVRKFLAGRVMAGSGLNIRFLTVVFEQCPMLAWSLHDTIMKCFLVREAATSRKESSADEDDKKTKKKSSPAKA